MQLALDARPDQPDMEAAYRYAANHDLAGYPPTGKARQYGIPISLSMDTVAWWSGDMFSAMRETLSAERARAFQLARAGGR